MAVCSTKAGVSKVEVDCVLKTLLRDFSADSGKFLVQFDLISTYRKIYNDFISRATNEIALH